MGVQVMGLGPFGFAVEREPDDAHLATAAEAISPGRLLVGLGAPQRPRALGALVGYLDRLDAADHPIPQERRILAAIGPRKLDMARERFAGAVPILVTPEYTSTARQRLGPDRVLAVGQFAVLDENPDTARQTARNPLRFLMTVRGYAESARRLGFSGTDLATLSDRLVDTLVTWGAPAEIAAKAHEHRAAGADHVQLTVLHSGPQPRSAAAARQLAPLLFRGIQ